VNVSQMLSDNNTRLERHTVLSYLERHMSLSKLKRHMLLSMLENTCLYLS